MSPELIIAILTAIERIGNMAITLFSEYQTTKTADPNLIDLDQLLKTQQSLQQIIQARVFLLEEGKDTTSNV